MADNPKITTEFVLDQTTVTAEFKKVSDALSKLNDKLNDASSEGKDGVESLTLGVIGLNQGIELASKAAEAFKVVLDFVLDAEKIIGIQNQFKVLGENAGVATEVLAKGLEKSAAGLIDNTDLLKVANSAFINLGASAAKLPEILELAQKATRVLGGDVQDRFAEIVGAIESGNQKALKNAGIIIDVQKAYKEYAISLHTTAGELTKAQQEQALLNAVLAQGGAKFGDIAEASNPVTQNLKRLGVGVHELEEQFSLFINSKFGDAFRSITGALGDAVSKLAEFQKQANEDNSKSLLQKQAEDAVSLRTQIIQTTANLENMKKEFAESGELSKSFFGEGQQEAIVATEQKLAKLQERFNTIGATFKDVTGKGTGESAPGAAGGGVAAKNDAALTADQLQQQQARNDQILQLQIKANTDFIAAEDAKGATLRTLQDQRLVEQETFGQKLILLGIQREEAIRQVEIQYSDQKGFDQTQRDAARLATIQDFNSKVEAENIKHNSKLQQLAIIQASTVKGIIANGLSATVQDIGVRLQQGESLFDNFGAGIVGIMGDLLINVGNALLVQGLAIEAFVDAINTLLPGSGVAVAAAGIGLILFGSILKASVGGKGSSGGAPSPGGAAAGGDTSGGGLTASPGDTTAINQPSDIAAQAPGTKVVLNVNGNIIPRDRNFALELSDLVRDAFETQGTVAVSGNT